MSYLKILNFQTSTDIHITSAQSIANGRPNKGKAKYFKFEAHLLLFPSSRKYIGKFRIGVAANLNHYY